MKESEFYDQVEKIYRNFEELINNIGSTKQEKLDPRKIKRRIIESFSVKQRELEKQIINYFDVS